MNSSALDDDLRGRQQLCRAPASAGRSARSRNSRPERSPSTASRPIGLASGIRLVFALLETPPARAACRRRSGPSCRARIAGGAVDPAAERGQRGFAAAAGERHRDDAGARELVELLDVDVVGRSAGPRPKPSACADWPWPPASEVVERFQRRVGGHRQDSRQVGKLWRSTGSRRPISAASPLHLQRLVGQRRSGAEPDGVAVGRSRGSPHRCRWSRRRRACSRR